VLSVNRVQQEENAQQTEPLLAWKEGGEEGQPEAEFSAFRVPWHHC